MPRQYHYSVIVATFPIVRRKDEEKHGHHRTKDTILQIYDALAVSQRTGTPYQPRLNPPPSRPALLSSVAGELTDPI